MVHVLEFEDLGASEDCTGLEAALRNSSLDGCKEVLPRRQSSDDEDDDGGQEHGEGGQTGDHARVTGTILDRAATNQWQIRKVGWKMTSWTTILIYTNRPCTTKQMPPVIPFSV
jgi:hypothetical protein